jgi:hypothetical protein
MYALLLAATSWASESASASTPSATSVGASGETQRSSSVSDRMQTLSIDEQSPLEPSIGTHMDVDDLYTAPDAAEAEDNEAESETEEQDVSSSSSFSFSTSTSSSCVVIAATPSPSNPTISRQKKHKRKQHKKGAHGKPATHQLETLLSRGAAEVEAAATCIDPDLPPSSSCSTIAPILEHGMWLNSHAHVHAGTRTWMGPVPDDATLLHTWLASPEAYVQPTAAGQPQHSLCYRCFAGEFSTQQRQEVCACEFSHILHAVAVLRLFHAHLTCKF